MAQRFGQSEHDKNLYIPHVDKSRGTLIELDVAIQCFERALVNQRLL